MKKILITLSVVSSLGMANANAQGCSDAGFCSVGALQSGIGKHDVERGAVAASIGVASGEQKTTIITPQLEFKLMYKEDKGYTEIKLPYNIISGGLGTNVGIGDLMMTYTSFVKMKSKSMKMNITGGFKIGLGNAGDDNTGKPLPMVYQTSTATTDVILGAGVKIQKYLNIALGVQQPVIQYNINGYDKSGLRDNDTSYFASRKLKRAGDVMLRVEGQYDFKNMGVCAGPLVIYHIMNDKMEATNGTKSDITGSAGLTLNVTAGFYYKAKTWRFDLNGGVPVLVRDSRPDGLTRSWVVVPRFSLYL